MKSKKPSLYDAQEEQIQLQSASFVDFLTRKGVLEDHNIDNERVRKAKKDRQGCWCRPADCFGAGKRR